MPNSPLTAALLANQNVDPTSLMITPEMQTAQSLMQQGMDTSPIRSPWQGVARLAQILAGQKIQSRALQSAAGAYGQAADDMAKNFPEGTAMHQALTSKNPMVRALAYQQAGKALLQLNEPQKISPTDQVVAPGAPAPLATSTVPMTHEGQLSADVNNDTGLAQNNALVAGMIRNAQANAQNSSDLQYKPQIAGQTARAEVAPHIAQAGGIAASEAPWKTVETRSGAILPLTAIPGIGQPTPTNTATPQPAAPPQPAPTSVQPQVPEKPAAPVPAPQQFGGGVRTLPGGVGVMAPSQDTFKDLIDQDTKEVAGDRENATKAQNDQATVTAIRDFMPKVKTGWTAPLRLEAGQILQAAGVDPKEVANFTAIDPANGQVLQKKFVELSTAAARQMGAREPGSVIQMFSKAYPSLETTPEAINLQSNALYMNAQRQQKLAAAKTNYLNQSVNDLQNTGEYRGLKGFNEQFNQTDNANDYLRAAEAMSGSKWSPWGKITDPADQHRIISLIPKGATFVGPDGQDGWVKN